MQKVSYARHMCGGETYLSNINESTHEVLVAESVDGLLSLLPRGIFYNAVILLVSKQQEKVHGNLPASLHNQRNNVPSVNPTFLQKPTKGKDHKAS
jgi:hypothetical protein